MSHGLRTKTAKEAMADTQKRLKERMGNGRLQTTRIGGVPPPTSGTKSGCDLNSPLGMQQALGLSFLRHAFPNNV